MHTRQPVSRFGGLVRDDVGVSFNRRQAFSAARFLQTDQVHPGIGAHPRRIGVAALLMGREVFDLGPHAGPPEWPINGATSLPGKRLTSALRLGNHLQLGKKSVRLLQFPDQIATNDFPRDDMSRTRLLLARRQRSSLQIPPPND